ncbi:MAG TPA: hypothetical protein VG826_19310 [Pirellulales bacterium]|nr:hypothetical protein [Pirellulales bacterium]
MRRKSRFRLFAASILGIVVGVLVPPAAPRPVGERSIPPAEAIPRVPAARVVPSPEEIIRPHLAWAEQTSAELLVDYLRQIDDFFETAKKGTPDFADRALSFGSKWRLVADHVPFARGGRHETFLRSQFEEHVFRPTQLGELIEQVVAGYLAQVRSIESEMLVKIRADIADFPETYVVAELDEPTLRARYDEALSDALSAAAGDLRSDVAGQVVSLIAGEVLTQVAARLGVSAGILGTGAASGWATFGIGVVVGLIVDQIVAWVWDWYADPSGTLARQLSARLEGVNRLIVDGSDGVGGLRNRLDTYAAGRAAVRETALLAILQTK